MGGWALRWRIWQTDIVTERFKKERESLGVPDGGWEGLIRKLKREGKGKGKEKEKERKVVEDAKLVAVVGRGKEDLVEEDLHLKEEEEEEEPSRDKAFMEETPPVKSLR